MKKIKRVLWLTAGCSAVATGTIGIFVPLLPTVPFLLLAVYCFSRSAPHYVRRLMAHRWLGPPLRDYHYEKSVKRSVKIKSIAFLWVSLSVSIALISLLWLRILLAVIGVAVTIHILMLKTKKTEREDHKIARP